MATYPTVADLYNGILAPRNPATMPISPNYPNMVGTPLPRATALPAPKPPAPPIIPNDPNRLAASTGLNPGAPDYVPPATLTQPTTQVASIPLPRPRPGDAMSLMDAQAIAALDAANQPTMLGPVTAYAPQAPSNPAVAAATAAGAEPQTSWLQDAISGLDGLLRGAGTRPGIGQPGGAFIDPVTNALRPAGAVGDGIGSSAGEEAWKQNGFGSIQAYRDAMNAWGAENGHAGGLKGLDRAGTDAFNAYLRSNAGQSAQQPAAQQPSSRPRLPPVSGNPDRPVTGGMMAPQRPQLPTYTRRGR